MDQIHLVDGEHKIPDAHERADAGVAARLRQHALCRIDEDDGKIRERCAAGHVARVLLVAGRVSANEAAIVCCEIAIRDIDRDALLALGEEAVKQQRIVDRAAAAADFRVEEQRFLLVGIQELRIVEQVADQRGFSVIDAAARDEFQQVVLFVHQK